MGTDALTPIADPDEMKAVIEWVKSTDGAETSNFQPFIERLLVALDLPRPGSAGFVPMLESF